MRSQQENICRIFQSCYELGNYELFDIIMSHYQLDIRQNFNNIFSNSYFAINISICKFLLDNYPVANNNIFVTKWFSIACSNNNTELALYLLNYINNINFDFKNIYNMGENPLLAICRHHNYQLFEQLLDKYANMEINLLRCAFKYCYQSIGSNPNIENAIKMMNILLEISREILQDSYYASMLSQQNLELSKYVAKLFNYRPIHISELSKLSLSKETQIYLENIFKEIEIIYDE